MTQMELQEVLGKRMNITISEMEPETRAMENEQTALVIGIAKQMIQNGDLILRT